MHGFTQKFVESMASWWVFLECDQTTTITPKGGVAKESLQETTNNREGFIYPIGNDHISHLGKRKVIFKSTFWKRDFLVPRRVSFPQFCFLYLFVILTHDFHDFLHYQGSTEAGTTNVLTTHSATIQRCGPLLLMAFVSANY